MLSRVRCRGRRLSHRLEGGLLVGLHHRLWFLRPAERDRSRSGAARGSIAKGPPRLASPAAPRAEARRPSPASATGRARSGGAWSCVGHVGSERRASPTAELARRQSVSDAGGAPPSDSRVSSARSRSCPTRRADETRRLSRSTSVHRSPRTRKCGAGLERPSTGFGRPDVRRLRPRETARTGPSDHWATRACSTRATFA